MILVPSHRQRSSGSKILLAVLIAFLAACSPRVRQSPPKQPDAPVVKPAEPADKESKSRSHSMALLLPFELNTMNVKTASAKELSKAALAIEFYQGVKLAIDSIAANGHDYKIHVFDTQDQETRVVNLAQAASVRENDLFIGPVFPDGVGTFAEFSDSDSTKLQISPLAASLPAGLKSRNVVSINNTVVQHGRKMAEFISGTYKADQIHIILINTRKTDDEKLAAPVRRYLKEFSKGLITITERPNAIGLQTYVKPDKRNIVVLCSSDRSFVIPIVDRLVKFVQEGVKVELFGHPNWAKANYLDAAKMQTLQTRFTSSYHVNYTSSAVKQFLARYREEYHAEPSEYAFKGFDVGFYFAGLLAKYGKQYSGNLTRERYRGLHNNFRFEKTNEGFFNTDLFLMQYKPTGLQVLK